MIFLTKKLQKKNQTHSFFFLFLSFSLSFSFSLSLPPFYSSSLSKVTLVALGAPSPMSWKCAP